MATHTSVLAWRIPRMGEPGGLPSLGSHRVGHDWSNLAHFENKIRAFPLLSTRWHKGTTVDPAGSGVALTPWTPKG